MAGSIRFAIALAALAIAAPAEAQVSTARAPALVEVYGEVLAAGTPLPRFKVDAAWPTLPAEMMLGQVSGVAIGRNDEVWIVHRPASLGPTDAGLAAKPPIAKCCRPAPTVVHFAKSGAYLGGFDAPAGGLMVDGVSQWPKSAHGVFVDSANTVWFGGNGEGDHVVLNFTADGKFIRQFGKREQTHGNRDQALLGNPSDVSLVDDAVLISDGYVNKRVIGFDDKTNAFKGFWGAYGELPPDTAGGAHLDPTQAAAQTDVSDPKSHSFGAIVHCVVRTRDDHVYVCDRRNNRAQEFQRKADGTLSFIRDLVISPETNGTRTVTDIALSPDEKFLYVADMMNGRIWILDRASHKTLAWIGRNGRYAGEFIWLHSIATDSTGNLYATEVNNGRRVQKFVFEGVR